jgi:hypothetical protein
MDADFLTVAFRSEAVILSQPEACERGKIGNDLVPRSQLPELNGKIQKKHRRKSVRRVLMDFDEAHQRTLALIDSLDDKQLTTIGFFPWTGKSWTLSDYFRGRTASHYRWARNKIRKWLAKID